MSRGVTCLWLVAVTQFAALLIVSVVQQLTMTDLNHQDSQLRVLLVELVKQQPDYTPSEEAVKVARVFSDRSEEEEAVSDDVTQDTRHKRQLAFDAILADLLRAQEQVIANHCSNTTKTCLQGPKGDKGTPGAQGQNGPKGSRGAVGAQGQKGAVGVKGERGVRGAAGPQGPPGDVGPTGLAGPQGATGGKGHKGDTGETGEAGKSGAPGNKGEPGDRGARGSPGPKGQPGAPERRERGGWGPRGPKGERGPAGESGEVIGQNCECLKAPHITNFPTDRTVQLGAPVQLTCQAEGNPPPQVTWSGRHTNGVLRIDHVISNDLHPYTCTATNPFGTDSRTVTLKT